MNDVVIKLENISKRYRLGQRGASYATLRDTIANLFRFPNKRYNIENTTYKYIWALLDISFEVERGQVLGIIGRNGAGKTTLLKILSRIGEPTQGRAIVKGRVGSLLEVGTGFHPELTGRENIYLNGAILGMKKKEINKKFDEIVAFAELEKFIDTTVKFYSSGMYVRLAFAVAAHLETEILLVDEVLAVGDAVFQKKCLGKMGDVAKGGRTVLFVSHNMQAIRQLCTKAVLLEDGKSKFIEAADKVVDYYLNIEKEKFKNEPVLVFERNPKKEFQVLTAKLMNNNNETAQNFECDEDITVYLECEVYERIPGLYGLLGVNANDGTLVMMSDSYDSPPNPLDELSVGRHTFKIKIPRRTLAPGSYNIFFNFTSNKAKTSFWVDRVSYLAFNLTDSKSDRGNYRKGYFSTLLHWQEVDKLQTRIQE